MSPVGEEWKNNAQDRILIAWGRWEASLRRRLSNESDKSRTTERLNQRLL